MASFETITIGGIAEYIHVNGSVATYEGTEIGYSLNLLLDENTEKELRKVGEEVLKSAKSPSWRNAKGKEVPANAWKSDDELLDSFIRTNKNGKKFVVCKAYHKDKNGNRIYVPIFDLNGRMDDEKAHKLNIYSGSEVNVEVTVYVYFNNRGMQGIKAKMRGLQVIKAVTGSGSVGSGFKFKKTADKPALTSATIDDDMDDDVPI